MSSSLPQLSSRITRVPRCRQQNEPYRMSTPSDERSSSLHYSPSQLPTVSVGNALRSPREPSAAEHSGMLLLIFPRRRILRTGGPSISA